MTMRVLSLETRMSGEKQNGEKQDSKSHWHG